MTTIQDLEAIKDDIKEKMGYDLVPNGTSIQEEIDMLEPEYVKSIFESMLDEAIEEESDEELDEETNDGR